MTGTKRGGRSEKLADNPDVGAKKQTFEFEGTHDLSLFLKQFGAFKKSDKQLSDLKVALENKGARWVKINSAQMVSFAIDTPEINQHLRNDVPGCIAWAKGQPKGKKNRGWIVGGALGVTGNLNYEFVGSNNRTIGVDVPLLNQLMQIGLADKNSETTKISTEYDGLTWVGYIPVQWCPKRTAFAPEGC